MPTTVLAEVSLRDEDGTTGRARLEVDWNTNNRRVTAARVVSTLNRAMVATLASPLLPGGAVAVNVGPLGTVETAIPGSSGLRWDVPAGNPDGPQVLDASGNPLVYRFGGA
jgi:hypothetical protein